MLGPKLLVLLPIVAGQQVTFLDCFVDGYGYEGVNETPSAMVQWGLLGAEDCRASCSAQVNCDHFTYNSKTLSCWKFNTTGMVLQPMANATTGTRNGARCSPAQQLEADLLRGVPTSGSKHLLGKLPWWAWVFISLGAALVGLIMVFAACCCACCSCCREKKKKASRATLVTKTDDLEAESDRPLMTPPVTPQDRSQVVTTYTAPPIYVTGGFPQAYTSQYAYTPQVVYQGMPQGQIYVSQPVVTAVVPFGQEQAVPVTSQLPGSEAAMA